MPKAAIKHPRGEATRAAILEEAEAVFAERGFDGTRLEEIAERVGIRRPAISYYFVGKEALYDAVLEALVGGLYERIRVVLERPVSLLERIEAAVTTWVDYVGARPTFARILLREVAAGQGGRIPGIARHIEPFFDLVRRLEAESEGDPLADDSPINAVHFASTIAGSTIFLVAAIPVLVPGSGFSRLDDEELAAHRAETLRVTRRLLGIRPARTQLERKKRPRASESKADDTGP
ncbi:MAG: TetR/AcrR family transcriptional regulator [Deltaproteobacteria bacterium]|nr:TetR/AcrR family transcriptional regulator [Deltaproteobacteria bacterium]MBW2396631.1 TetR/AcrR family transcriptional regulator [Deltaproteobacteria bacterium]